LFRYTHAITFEYCWCVVCSTKGNSCQMYRGWRELKWEYTDFQRMIDMLTWLSNLLCYLDDRDNLLLDLLFIFSWLFRWWTQHILRLIFFKMVDLNHIIGVFLWSLVLLSRYGQNIDFDIFFFYTLVQKIKTLLNLILLCSGSIECVDYIF
jgi:hypothetical protein